MRTGISLIKGMSWAAKKPIIGISTLDILALNAGDTDKQIIPIIDAKRNLIYASAYKKKNNKLIKIKPYMLLSEEELFKIAKNDCLILGDAIDLYKEKILANIKGATVLDKDYWYPKPRNIINIALERIKHKKLNNPFDIRAIYLYPKECQIREVK
jgi:tRNA threonylcarbamoyl adenosine modification protein YeaZ